MAASIDFIALGRRFGLDLDPGSLEVEDIGLDFAVGFATDRAGKRWVLRVPRRDDAWPGAEREGRMLEWVAPRLPVAVPRWEVKDRSLIAYRRLPGIPLLTVRRTGDGGFEPTWRLDPGNLPDSFIQSLAALVTTLERIPAPEGIPVPTPADVRRRLTTRLEAARETAWIHPVRLERWRRWIEDDAIWPDAVLLVHGEMHGLHLLIAEVGTPVITGLLDWTEAEYSDPGIEFSVFLKMFGEGMLARIIERFELESGRRWPRLAEHAKLWESFFPIGLLEFALRSGDASYLSQAREALATE